MRGAAIREGKTYSFKTVQNATQYLESQLIKQDYLGTRVQLAGAEFDPETRRADVHFNVTPGPRAHVKIEGAHVWSWTQRKLIPMYQQAGLDPELLQEGRQNLISYFQSKGYFNVQVNIGDAVLRRDDQTILYKVNTRAAPQSEGSTDCRQPQNRGRRSSWPRRRAEGTLFFAWKIQSTTCPQERG